MHYVIVSDITVHGIIIGCFQKLCKVIDPDTFDRLTEHTAANASQPCAFQFFINNGLLGQIPLIYSCAFHTEKSNGLQIIGLIIRISRHLRRCIHHFIQHIGQSFLIFVLLVSADRRHDFPHVFNILALAQPLLKSIMR